MHVVYLRGDYRDCRDIEMRQGREESSQWCVRESSLWATGVQSPHGAPMEDTHREGQRACPLALKSILPTAPQNSLARRYPASDPCTGLQGRGLLPQMPSP